MKAQMSSTGFMPKNVAIALLTSGQAMTNPFRKRCLHATERVCEPVSRSTALPVSAPKTGSQRLQARLKKATAAQLHKWAKRTLARGNRYRDQHDDVLFEMTPDPEKEQILELLGKQIAAHDALCEAIQTELTSRSTRGIGYKKPVKFKNL
jgi:hypothetical protein